MTDCLNLLQIPQVNMNGHSWCYMLCTIFQYFSFSNSSAYTQKQTMTKKQTIKNKKRLQCVHFNRTLYDKATEYHQDF